LETPLPIESFCLFKKEAFLWYIFKVQNKLNVEVNSNMKKNAIIFGAMLILIFSILGGCGSNTKQTDSSSPANSSSSNQNNSTVKTGTKATPTAAPGKTVDIKVMAKDFEYDKKVIRVKKGDKVQITLHSDDGGHGFTIPAYNVTINGNGSAEFTANKAGTYEYHCSVMCGSGHSKMTGKLIVE
jgi:cytochrome c oxidase subunit 2